MTLPGGCLLHASQCTGLHLCTCRSHPFFRTQFTCHLCLSSVGLESKVGIGADVQKQRKAHAVRESRKRFDTWANREDSGWMSSHFISGLHRQQDCVGAWQTSTPLSGRNHVPTAAPTVLIRGSKVMKEDKRQWTWLCALNLWNTRTFRLGFSRLKFSTARGLGFQS